MRRDPMRWGFLGLCLGLFWGLGTVYADSIRPSAIAGYWYPQEPAQLQEIIDQLLKQAGPAPSPPPTELRALVSPHAGYQYSGATAAKGYIQLQGRALKRVIAVGPAHGGGFRGLAIPEASHYATPLGSIPLDTAAIATLRASPLVHGDEAIRLGEHSLEIQLPFLQRSLAPGWQLLPVLVGVMEEQDYAAAAELLRPLLDDTSLLLISGDFTHYGPRYDYLPFPPDQQLPERLRNLDLGAFEFITKQDAPGLAEYHRRTGITACGLSPLLILVHLLNPGSKVELIQYDTSGALTQQWDHSVSYLSIGVYDPAPLSKAAAPKRAETAPTPELLPWLHRLARIAVIDAVLPQSGIAADYERLLAEMPEAGRQPSGAFVTLKKHGELRGCIGYILPKEPLYRAVILNGLNAAQQDYRFPPVQPEELKELELTVSVLSPPQSIPSVEDFQPGVHGIILHKEGRSAVFLPEVAREQGWNREQTLSHLARKAGLPEDAWKEGAAFEVFTTQHFEAPLAVNP